MTNFLKGSLAAAMFAGTMAATPALANDEAAITTSMVEYGDLDLSTERGQDRLHSRLRRAARYSCGMDIRNTGTLMPSREARACYADNLRSFDRQVAALVEAETRRA